MEFDRSPVWLALFVAGLSTLLSLGPALWLARVLELRPSRAADLLANALLALPPAIVVAYFLFRFSEQSFPWPVAVLAGVVNAVPMLLRASLAALRALEPRYENAARSFGLPESRIFWRVALPMAWQPLTTATAVAFARNTVEYVAVVMIARRLAS